MWPWWFEFIGKKVDNFTVWMLDNFTIWMFDNFPMGVIWQFSCTATTSFIILYHDQTTFGWLSCKNHSRFKVDNFPGWLWVMIFVWQISCMAVNFFWQISGMAVRSEIRLTIFLFFVLKLVDNFTIWQNYRNPYESVQSPNLVLIGRTFVKYHF